MRTQTTHRIDITDDIVGVLAAAELLKRVENTMTSVIILADVSFDEARAEIAAGGALRARMIKILGRHGISAEEAENHIQNHFDGTMPRVWFDNAWRRILGEDLELEWD